MEIYRTSRARENILSKIRKELAGNALSMPFPEAEKEDSPIYAEPNLSAEETFAKQFVALGGKFVFCDHEQEVLENLVRLQDHYGWQKILCNSEEFLEFCRSNGADILLPIDNPATDADACVTDSECLVARTGSFMFSSRQAMGRTSSVYYPVHLVVAYADQVVNDIQDGFALVRKKYKNDMPSMISLATGPSRTADIEKTLVVGVHGPCEVFCFLINRYR